MTLAELAAEELAHPIRAMPLEKVWIDAALRSLAVEHPMDPDRSVLFDLTSPDIAWKGAEATVDSLQDRIGRLRDCQLLAIAEADQKLLGRLSTCWKAAPPSVDPPWPIRALGEISLAWPRKRSHGTVWTAEDIEWLMDEGILRDDVAADRAWLSLALGKAHEANQAIKSYATAIAKARTEWTSDPKQGIRQAKANPGVIQCTELRALRRLVAGI